MTGNLQRSFFGCNLQGPTRNLPQHSPVEPVLLSVLKDLALPYDLETSHLLRMAVWALILKCDQWWIHPLGSPPHRRLSQIELTVLVDGWTLKGFMHQFQTICHVNNDKEPSKIIFWLHFARSNEEFTPALTHGTYPALGPQGFG